MDVRAAGPRGPGMWHLGDQREGRIEQPHESFPIDARAIEELALRLGVEPYRRQHCRAKVRFLRCEANLSASSRYGSGLRQDLCGVDRLDASLADFLQASIEYLGPRCLMTGACRLGFIEAVEQTLDHEVDGHDLSLA